MKDRILDMQIKQLAESQSYAPATRMIKQLKEVGSFSDKQVNELLFWYLDNDQISGASGEYSILRPLFEERRENLHSNLLTMYDLFKKTDYRPTHRLHLRETVITKIQSLKPELTSSIITSLIQQEIDTNDTHTYAALETIIQNQNLSISVPQVWRDLLKDYI